MVAFCRLFPLLDALSREEPCYTVYEENVVDLEGKSLVIAQDLEGQYGFMGVSRDKCKWYFHRYLYWGTADEVKSIAGFPVVPK